MPGLGSVASKQISVLPQRLLRPLSLPYCSQFVGMSTRQAIHYSSAVRSVSHPKSVGSTPPTLIRFSHSPRRTDFPFLRQIHDSVSQAHRRGLSFGPGKIIFKLFRVPMAAAGSAILGGAAYVNYKVKEVSSFTTDKLSQATEYAQNCLITHRK